MKLYDSVELAARNLRESVLRNSLTTLGISVGVASLVAMLSLGIGLQQLASRRLQRSGLFDSIVVTSRRDLRGYNREQEESGPAPAESPDLNETARLKIVNVAGVPSLQKMATALKECKESFFRPKTRTRSSCKRPSPLS